MVAVASKVIASGKGAQRNTFVGTGFGEQEIGTENTCILVLEALLGIQKSV